MNNNSSQWIKIHSFTDLQTAYIIKGAMEAENIPAMIPSDTLTTVYPTTLTWSAIDLYVPEACEDRALMILKENGL
ncbi:MAG: DUF2007 domain-containing protein [Muribaculaceae bacterium]|nr:DUF2007 domain-containing protein [Muribaculaceae bacterium]